MKILQEDYDLLKARLIQIKQELRDLAEEFNIVLNQSSETWHDNAPWDDAKGRERVLLTEQENLKKVLTEGRIVPIEADPYIGNKYTVNFNGNKLNIYLAGEFTMRLGQEIDGYTIVSLNSPVAQSLINK